MSIDIDNADSNNYNQRSVVLSKLSINFNKLQIISDMSQFLNVLYNSNQADFKLTFRNDKGLNIPIDLSDIYGSLYCYDRRVVNGQLASIKLDLSFFIKSMYSPIYGAYGIELLITLDFPQ
jgi:hypothetical protein